MNTNTGAPTAHSLDVLRVLEAARTRIAKGWTQRAHARSPDGTKCYATELDAVSWCSSGAIVASGGDIGGDAYGYLELAIGRQYVNSWNDAEGRTQAEVLAAFDKAIGIAQGTAAEGRP